MKEEDEFEDAKARALSSRGGNRHGESELRSSHPRTAKKNLDLIDLIITAASVIWDCRVGR